MNMRDIINLVESAPLNESGEENFHFEISFNGKPLKAFDQNLMHPHDALAMLAKKLPQDKQFVIRVTDQRGMFDHSYIAQGGNLTNANQEKPESERESYF
jgi:hypothetical protein